MIDPAAPPPLPPVDDDEPALRRLKARLAASAEHHGLLDVAYRTLDTPIGTLLIAATPAGLVRLAFAGEGHDRVLADLAERISARVLQDTARLDSVARQLDEYFTGERRSFSLDLDLSLASGFRRAVLDQLLSVAYGATASYAELAARTASPRAVRAVGTACATNPLPIVVPCHRVVRSDGTIGQYLGGPKAKRLLLDMEARAITA